MGKISVIIPIYNTEEFLDDCIYSVINQTYDNLEIILINDGSTTDVQKQIEDYASKDNRIKYYQFNTRHGVGYARNFGVKKATGTYIYFLDSDDYIRLDALQQLVENIGDSDIICGKIKRTNIKEEVNNIGQKASVKEIHEKVRRRKIFRNRSALHRLFRKKYIVKNKMKFAEDIKVYSDLAFIVPAMINAKKISHMKSSIYFKRKRNDPISNPSLIQMDKETLITSFLTIYEELKKKYNFNKEAQKYLDYHFINFYRKTIILYFTHIENIDNIYSKLIRPAKLISKDRLSKINPVVRMEFRYLIKEDINKYRKAVLFHQTLRFAKRSFQSRRKFYLTLYRLVFMKMPMKEDTIVFESFLGKNYSDSPKYIYEYMLENNYKYKFIWIFNSKDKKIPGRAKIVQRFSLAYYYYLARSKYWVSNSRLPKHLNKRAGNIYLQTWHGTPLKKLVFDMKDIYSANPNYKKDFYEQSRRWDYLIAANKYSSDIFKSAFMFDKTMLEYGYPRNDILYKDDAGKTATAIRQKLSIPTDKKVILYAPTWRDNDFFEAGKYRFNLSLNLEKMQQAFGDEYVIILRMHYFIANQLDVSKYEGFVFDLSSYDDIAELYLISDILITDYSSVFFDYANLKRPILFYTYDLEQYRDTLRGFYINMEKEAPGPLIKTTEEVIYSIKHIDEIKEQYKENYDTFYNKFCSWENGNATEKVVKTVFKD